MNELFCNVIWLYYCTGPPLWGVLRNTSAERILQYNTLKYCNTAILQYNTLKVRQPSNGQLENMYNVCNCCTTFGPAGYLDVFKVAESNMSEVFSLGG